MDDKDLSMKSASRRVETDRTTQAARCKKPSLWRRLGLHSTIAITSCMSTTGWSQGYPFQPPMQPAQASQAVPAMQAAYSHTPNAIPGSVGTDGVQWVSVGQVTPASNDCNTCGPMAVSPGFSPPVHAFPTTQHVGLSSGACQPCIQGIDCADSCGREQRWNESRPIDFQPLLHGEFLGPVRLPAVQEMRLRVGDEIRFTYLLNRDLRDVNQRLQVGDEILISSVTDSSIRLGDLQKGLTIQTDGNIYPQMIDPIPAAGLTLSQLRQKLEEAYKKYLKTPAIDVIPVKTNTRLEDLKTTVDARFGTGGLGIAVTVNPDGRINLPGIGSVYVYGMSIDEIKREINLRYAEKVAGIEVEPSLGRLTPHFVYVYGEVGKPGRYELTGPTTVSQALAMAENIRTGGNHREVVIFRRAEDWRLMATKLDLRGAHLGRRPDPSDQIWLRDSDLIIVPPMPIKLFDNFVEQVFTKGVYGIVPFGGISIQQQQ